MTSGRPCGLQQAGWSPHVSPSSTLQVPVGPATGTEQEPGFSAEHPTRLSHFPSL